MTQETIPETNDTLQARLVLDVSYTLNGVKPDVMLSNLNRMCERAIGEGMLTNGTDAEVDEYSMGVEVAKEEAATPPISKIAGVLIERIGVALRLARKENNDQLFDSIDQILCKDIQTMDENAMSVHIRGLESLIESQVNASLDDGEDPSSSGELHVTQKLVSNSDDYIDVDVNVLLPNGSEFMQRMYVTTGKPDELIRDEIRFSPSQVEDFDEGGKVECSAEVLAAFEAAIPAVTNLIQDAAKPRLAERQGG